jgi:hypothetical protein
MPDQLSKSAAGRKKAHYCLGDFLKDRAGVNFHQKIFILEPFHLPSQTNSFISLLNLPSLDLSHG